MILLTALLLGIVHGITPDEHTWPITFSYAIGSYSTRRGLLSGIAFSGAFTVQRALACVLAYVALARWLQGDRVNAVVDLLVGIAMVGAGAYILRLGRSPHLHLPSFRREKARRLEPAALEQGTTRAVRPWMAALHGFIAGWGVGPFAILLYTRLAPSMPNVATSWLPGLAFGVGTMLTQAAAGALFGWWMWRRRLPEQAIGPGRASGRRNDALVGRPGLRRRRAGQPVRPATGRLADRDAVARPQPRSARHRLPARGWWWCWAWAADRWRGPCVRQDGAGRAPLRR